MSSSSTSSSDPATSETACAGRGFPWALLWAVVMLGAVEAAARCAEPRDMITYERGVATRYAVREHVAAYGSAEVCFAGSSRVHVGIVVPEVAEVLGERLGRPVAVANYASGGALIQENAPLVEWVLRHEPRPRVLVYGVDPEQIRGPELWNERSVVFWTPSDLLDARTRLSDDVLTAWPDVARNCLRDWSCVFRYRARPLSWLKERFRPRESSPILGERLDIEHGSDPDRSLLDHPADVAEVRKHVETAHLAPDGTYPFNERKVEMFAEMLRHCREHGVRVVLLDLPNAAVFNQFLPDGVYPHYREAMRRVAGAEGARFVTLEELGLSFGDADFRDPVHLNYPAGKRLSARLAEQVLVPELERSADPAGTTRPPR